MNQELKPAIFFITDSINCIDNICNNLEKIPRRNISIPTVTMNNINYKLINDIIKKKIKSDYKSDMINQLIIRIIDNMIDIYFNNFLQVSKSIIYLFYKKINNILNNNITNIDYNRYDSYFNDMNSQIKYIYKSKDAIDTFRLYEDIIFELIIVNINIIGNNIWNNVINNLNKYSIDNSQYYYMEYKEIVNCFNDLMANITYEVSIFSNNMDEVINFYANLENNGVLN